MIHLAMNGVKHSIYHLGNPDRNYLTSITKIQGSSLMVCTDSILRRLYLFDLYRAYGPAIEEVYGYHLNDLSVSSTLLIDDDDGLDTVCGDICVDFSGHNLYALIIRNTGAAWIKVYKIMDRKISFTGMRYLIPYDALHYLIPQSLSPEGLSPTNVVTGTPIPYNKLCYGSGIELLNGLLYVITRQRVPFANGGIVYYSYASMLTVIRPESGKLIDRFLLSRPSFESTGDGIKDAVFHGLTKIDGKLLTQVRYDHSRIRSDSRLWLPTSNMFIRTRGQTALITIDDPIASGVASMSLLKSTPLFKHFPYGVAMAYSITTDQSDRKMYAVFGNQVWDFEILDYTFIVRYPQKDAAGNITGYSFFEGDIIDLGDIVTDDVRTEIQCFLRNDSTHDMIDVEITLELDGVDKRLDDIFISLTQTSFGYKHLNLGTIVPGGSKEFWVETHPLNVGQIEINKTHRLPIRVSYKVDYDDI